MNNKEEVINEFKKIPGVGNVIAHNLWKIGIHSISDLKSSSPEELYERLSLLENQHADRCALYVFRLVVYYVNNTRHKPELLKWWNWKDKDTY